MTIQEYMRDGDRAAAYKKWLSDPVTVFLKEHAREVAAPIPLVSPNSNDALYYHGMQVGFQNLLDLVFRADIVADRLTAIDKGNAITVPDYGSVDMIKKGDLV